MRRRRTRLMRRDDGLGRFDARRDDPRRHVRGPGLRHLPGPTSMLTEIVKGKTATRSPDPQGGAARGDRASPSRRSGSSAQCSGSACAQGRAAQGEGDSAPRRVGPGPGDELKRGGSSSLSPPPLQPGTRLRLPRGRKLPASAWLGCAARSIWSGATARATLDVCPVDELPLGSVKIVRAANSDRRVPRDGELYAIEDRCSHDDGPLCEAIGTPTSASRSALAGARFDITTGAALFLP